MLANFNLAGTSFIKEIEANYFDLVKAFGEPTETGLDKSNFQWIVNTDKGVATIYDWGKGEIYGGYINNWHIGGHTTEVADEIEKMLKKVTSN